MSPNNWLTRWLRTITNRYIVQPIGIELLQLERRLMASIDEVIADFQHYQSDVAAALGALKSSVDDLTAKLAAGNAVESADLDKLKADIDAADAGLHSPAALEGSTDPVEPPPPGEVSGPPH
jgi:predicted XRE-type DNA-binding protein